MKVLVEFSGGKDSVVALHMAISKGYDVTAIYNDMGDSYVHVVDYIMTTCQEWKVPLIISRPRIGVLESVKTDGYPSDIITIWSGIEGSVFTTLREKPFVKLQSGLACCAKHLFEPLALAVALFKPDEVWRGSKSNDDHVTAGPVFDHFGIKGFCPLWDYTDEKVFFYITEHNISLPAHYDFGVAHSLDCIHCTAWLGPAETGRAKFTATCYPVEFKELTDRFELIQAELDRQLVFNQTFLTELRSATDVPN